MRRKLVVLGTTLAASVWLCHSAHGAKPMAKRVPGFARSPKLSVVGGADFDFGSRRIGTTTSHHFTLRNDGKHKIKDLRVGSLSPPFAASTDCSPRLRAGATCGVTVTFSPTTANGATANLLLHFRSGRERSTLTIPLNGTGTTPARLGFVDSLPLVFPATAVGDAAAVRELTLTNFGGSPATAIRSSVTSSPFSVESSDCGEALPPSASCRVSVRFSPQSAGTYHSEVHVTYHDGSTESETVKTMEGTGANPAELVISEGPSFGFGSLTIGRSSEHQFTIRNKGDLAAGDLSLSVTGPFIKGATTCQARLEPNSSCSMTVSFTPVIQGRALGELASAYFDGVGARTFSVELTGSGTLAAVLGFSDAVLDFGTRVIGGPGSALSVTVTNSGETPAIGMTVSPPVFPFGFAGGVYPGEGGDCEETLPAGTNCRLVVWFGAESQGVYQGVLRLSYNDGVIGREISSTLKGAAANRAELVVSDGAVFDFGTVTLGQRVEHRFVFTNSGESIAGNLASAVTGSAVTLIATTCISHVEPHASCELLVSFAPVTAEKTEESLWLSYFDGVGNRSLSIRLSGEGKEVIRPGDLDLTFGGTGTITSDPRWGALVGKAVAIQPDGRILIAGYASSGATYSFAVARFNSDGTADSLFGRGGFSTFAIGPSDDRANGLRLLPNGKILVVGYSFNGTDKDIAVVRLHSDGTLDQTFGGGRGYVKTDIAFADDVANDIAIQIDGRLVVAGYSFIDTDNDFVAVRYLADGKRDTSFNGGGVVSSDFGWGRDEARSLIIQPDGKIVLAGMAKRSSSRYAFGLARYHASGQYDTTFNGNPDAIATTFLGTGDAEASRILILSDGKLLVVGSAEDGPITKFALTRYEGNGKLDTTFGNLGSSLSAIGAGSASAQAILVQSPGDNLWVAGTAMTESSGRAAVLARFTSSGTLDWSFGQAGYVLTSSSLSHNNFGVSIAIQPWDQKIVLGGYATDGGNYSIFAARYNP